MIRSELLFVNLQLRGFAGNLFLVISHGIETLDDDLLSLLILHIESLGVSLYSVMYNKT